MSCWLWIVERVLQYLVVEEFLYLFWLRVGDQDLLPFKLVHIGLPFYLIGLEVELSLNKMCRKSVKCFMMLP